MKRFRADARRTLVGLGLSDAQIDQLERNADIARHLFTGLAKPSDVHDALDDIDRRAEALLDALNGLVRGRSPGPVEAARLMDYYLDPQAKPDRFGEFDPGLQRLRHLADEISNVRRAIQLSKLDVLRRRRKRNTTSPALISLLSAPLEAGARSGGVSMRVTRNPGNPFLTVVALFAELVFGEPHDLDRALREFLRDRKSVDPSESFDNLDEFRNS